MVEITEGTEVKSEFLERFGYRVYDGTTLDRKSRIWSLIWFEVTSTWHRSMFGKVLLVILLVFNFIFITISVFATEMSVSGAPKNQQDEAFRDALNGFVASYLNFGDSHIRPGTITGTFDMQMNIGILIIALFAIAGSGFFADDRQGRVIEIYLSRLQKKEYIIGKIGAILIYTNFFLMVPLLIMGALQVQSSNRLDHFEAIDFYLGIILFCFLASLIIGLGILAFSSISEKRHYASLGLILIYIIGSIFGMILTEIDPSNEFLLLVSPSFFLVLLAYVCLGDFKLGLRTGWDDENFEPTIEPLLLNDGSGLEYWHILGVAFLLIGLLIAFLSIKINRMTTSEL